MPISRTDDIDTAPPPAGWFDEPDFSQPAVEEIPPELASTGSPEAAVKAAVVGDRPPAPDPLDPNVALPRGITNEQGILQDRAVIRELNGNDEETISRIRTESETFDTIIALGTESIGDIRLCDMPVSERRAKLGRLLVGERWMLFFAIAKATFGNEKELEFECGKCEFQHSTTVLVDVDFPVKFPDRLDLHHEYRCEKSGDLIRYRLVIGSDVGDLQNKKGVTQSEVTSTLLSRVIQEVNGTPVADPVLYVKQLSMLDRARLVEAIDKNQANVDMTLRVDCQGCGEEVVVPLAWGHFFRP